MTLFHTFFCMQKKVSKNAIHSKKLTSTKHCIQNNAQSCFIERFYSEASTHNRWLMTTNNKGTIENFKTWRDWFENNIHNTEYTSDITTFPDAFQSVEFSTVCQTSLFFCINAYFRPSPMRIILNLWWGHVSRFSKIHAEWSKTIHGQLKTTRRTLFLFNAVCHDYCQFLQVYASKKSVTVSDAKQNCWCISNCFG